MTDDKPRIQARLTDGLDGWLYGREQRMNQAADNHNRQAIAELVMWRAVLEAELRRIRLTLAQANCIADVCNGFMLDMAIAGSVGMVYAECYDAFRFAREAPGGDISSYGRKWGPEDCDAAKWEQDLLDLLGRLGPAADHALRDAIARWWDISGTEWDHEPNEDEIKEQEIRQFESVGLRIIEG